MSLPGNTCSLMGPVLLDTDVIIDFLADRKPYSAEAAQLFTLIDRKKIKGYVSSLCFSNLYYVLRKAGSHEKVIKSLRELTELVEIVMVDDKIIKSALSSGFKDFEDAIQYYACLASGKISFIITRNTKDYKGSELPVMTPEMFLSLLQKTANK